MFSSPRAYFTDSATSEMLARWRAMLFCPFDRSMVTALKYINLFLPTNNSFKPEHSYELWLDDIFRWDLYNVEVLCYI